MRPSLFACLLAAGLTLAACGAPAPSAPVARAAAVALTELPPMRRFAPSPADPPARSNFAMAQDFIELSFELESGRSLDVMTRFEGPVRVRMTGPVAPTAPGDLARLLARLRSEAGIDIVETSDPGAEITIEFMPRATLQRRVPSAACFVAPRVRSWADYGRASRADLDWTSLATRTHAAIFVPNDTSPQEVRDCLHEELAQALGPLNDLFRLPDSVFNDDNIHTVLTGFDMLMLRATYAPEMRSGLMRAEAAARLPGLLSRLNPGGDRGPSPRSDPTPQAYVAAIERALGPGAFGTTRKASARTAVRIAEDRHWFDTRAGFAWLVLGRLSLGDREGAKAAFQNAEAIYAGGPGLGLQLAHADLQLAAFALAEGRPAEVLARTGRSIPVAARAENAALLASLLMFRAQALEMTGDRAEAALVRLDSLGWARYGFGSDAEVRDRLISVATLAGPAVERLP